MPGCRQQYAPHFLFGLTEKKTGRARSKRKERHGGSVRAERVPPAAGGGWLAVPRRRADKTRYSWGILGPGEGPDTLVFSFRWRWSGSLPGYPLGRCPGGKRGPTRTSAPTGCRRESGERTPHLPPCRGGCPHPPVSRPSLTTKQSASKFRRTDLSTSTPSFPPDRYTWGQSGANAQVRREPVEDFPVLVSTHSEISRI